MKTLFIALQFINPIIIIFSFAFAFIILRRGRDPIYFNFGMATLFLALWLTASEIMYLIIPDALRIIVINLTFAFGILIMHYFTIFTFYFPSLSSVRNRPVTAILYLLSFLVALSTIVPGMYVQRAVLDYPFLYVSFNNVNLTIFTLYFIVLTAISFNNLFKKYINSVGIHKIQLKKVIIGASVVIFINLFLSILLYFVTDFDTNIIGAFFAFAVIVLIFSMLFS